MAIVRSGRADAFHVLGRAVIVRRRARPERRLADGGCRLARRRGTVLHGRAGSLDRGARLHGSTRFDNRFTKTDRHKYSSNFIGLSKTMKTGGTCQCRSETVVKSEVRFTLPHEIDL